MLDETDFLAAIDAHAKRGKDPVWISVGEFLRLMELANRQDSDGYELLCGVDRAERITVVPRELRALVRAARARRSELPDPLSDAWPAAVR